MSTALDRTPVARWVRIGLIALALPNVAAGAWAVLSPQGWFDGFPGWDPRLVAAEPPYNAHLATDAGAGLLAAGVVLVLGAWLADRRTVQVALVAHAAFAIPHTAFHVLNPSDQLTAGQDAQNAATLVFAVVATVVLLAGSRSSVNDTVPTTARAAAG